MPLLGEEGEYTFISQLAVEDRVRAALPPQTKEECEVLLMVGLPGSGKSYWSTQAQKDFPDKRYYVLGTNNIIDKMRVSRHNLITYIHVRGAEQPTRKLLMSE